MLTKLTSHRPEYTGALRRFVVIDDNACVLIKLNVRTVGTAKSLYASYYNSLDKDAFLNEAAGGLFLYSTYDYISDVAVTSAGAAQHSDAHKLFCTGVVSYLH